MRINPTDAATISYFLIIHAVWYMKMQLENLSYELLRYLKFTEYIAKMDSIGLKHFSLLSLIIVCKSKEVSKKKKKSVGSGVGLKIRILYR